LLPAGTRAMARLPLPEEAVPMPSTSPAGRDRARRHDQALDRARAAAGQDRNRDAADRPGPGGLDQTVSRRLPNTHNGRVAR
jgi:hypothetical protein